jgi:DNA-directed RNA polymerase subunit beta
VVDGILLTPYHPVARIRGKKRLTDKIVYLTSTEEFQYRIGDLLDIEMDENRILKDTKVTARVPAAPGHSEKTTIATISSHSLDYVNVLPEQHLSPTAMLIPFAASDDGARVSFGLNLIRQSIYVQHSNVPLVTTSMYQHVFDYSDTYIHRARTSGVVVAIESDTLILQYDDETVEKLIYVPETRVTNDAVTVMNYKVRAGDRFKEKQILVDSDVSREGFFSPGVNLLTCYIPFDGYNYEDAIVLAKKAASKFISISGNTVEKEIKHSDSEIININPGNYFKYIPEGGVISVIDRIKGADSRRDATEPMIAHKASGILYDIQSDVNEHGDRVAKAQLLGFNRLGPGDKMAGLHGNKGVVSLVEENSNMPMFLNGMVADAVLNPCGVVSRMNIGQELEAHTGFIAYLLGIRIESDPFNGATVQDIKNLMKFVYDIANQANVESAIAMNPGFPVELYERARERHTFIREWEGCFEKDGSAIMYNQQTGEMFEFPITFGMPYLLKIMHEVDDKVHARAGVMEEEYSMLEKQPTKGSSRGGGQRIGEMEMHAFLAHGATELARELTNEKSDNVDLRINLLMDQLGRERIFQEGEAAPRTTEVFRYLLEVMGVKMEIDELPPVDYETVRQKTQFDAKALAKKIEESSVKDILKKEDKQRSLMSSLNDL